MAIGSGPPPSSVLAAFGVTGELERLPGGQGGTWLAGGVVFKQIGTLRETAWRAETVAGLAESARFRVPQPVRTRDGAWVAFGWEAWRQVPGEPDVRRRDEILHAGEAFHAALAGLPRPSYLDDRDDPWSYGDRVAWGELPVAGAAAWAGLLESLEQVRRPVALPAQPVHGDLLGNVLFADGLPPAVIDWPVYYRPASWALAVAVIDALTWCGAPRTLLDRGTHLPGWTQMLVRALMYRIATNEGFRRRRAPLQETPDAYHPVVHAVLVRCLQAT